MNKNPLFIFFSFLSLHCEQSIRISSIHPFIHSYSSIHLSIYTIYREDGPRHTSTNHLQSSTTDSNFHTFLNINIPTLSYQPRKEASTSNIPSSLSYSPTHPLTGLIILHFSILSPIVSFQITISNISIIYSQPTRYQIPLIINFLQTALYLCGRSCDDSYTLVFYDPFYDL